MSLLGHLALLGVEYYIAHNLVKGIVNLVKGDTKEYTNKNVLKGYTYINFSQNELYKHLKFKVSSQ